MTRALTGPYSLAGVGRDIICMAESVLPAYRLSQKPGHHWQARHEALCRQEGCWHLCQLLSATGRESRRSSDPVSNQLGSRLEEAGVWGVDQRRA